MVTDRTAKKIHGSTPPSSPESRFKEKSKKPIYAKSATENVPRFHMPMSIRFDAFLKYDITIEAISPAAKPENTMFLPSTPAAVFV